jgi:AhpD family alkylhydroperoxidase
VHPAVVDLCLDPQTSGGLLIAVAEANTQPLLQRLHDEGCQEAAIVGTVVGTGSGRIHLRSDGSRPIPPASPIRIRRAETPAANETAACCAATKETKMDCCQGNHESQANVEATGTADTIQQKFQEFVKAAGAPGALDTRTKQAIAIALSVMAKCEPCVKHHVKKALDMGFSQAEIDEAAWMAVAFGGSPTNMFYVGTKKG